LTRGHVRVAWLAVVALLIDGLLPSALAVAAGPNAAGPLALCSAAPNAPSPSRQAPVLPARHCALCAGWFIGLLPHRPDGLIAPLPGETAALGVVASVAAGSERADYPAAQPRAPPPASA
jgi:hypothetical protein